MAFLSLNKCVVPIAQPLGLGIVGCNSCLHKGICISGTMMVDNGYFVGALPGRADFEMPLCTVIYCSLRMAIVWQRMTHLMVASTLLDQLNCWHLYHCKGPKLYASLVGCLYCPWIGILAI